ncbi:MAG TPA: TetR/AcrR family transcriptional regulator [Streptosporangiaceae bacterium]|jgi:AcrR family transcriptional regulator|nr:TetR/AcrR family transcriptional regulator [Streptosporangiaceae bacterium]
MMLDRRAKLREATRQEILAAAWDIAREQGIGAVTLREIAARIGMQPPSLYTHFPSKMAIYDAMYRQGWEDYLAVVAETEPRLPAAPRAALAMVAAGFFDFALAEPARAQLMNQRLVPGFEPTAEAYAPAVETLDRLRAVLARLGAGGEAAADLFTALVAGLVSQQIANDPGGRRWRRLLERAIDMYADEMGLPGPRLTAPAGGRRGAGQ